MNYCSERGMPHSEFLEWDDQDRAKQLAFLMDEGERCQLCGTAPWEWEHNHFAYTPMEKNCRGCYLKSIASDNGQSMPGTTIELVPSSAALTAKLKLQDRRRRIEQAKARAEAEEERR